MYIIVNINIKHLFSLQCTGNNDTKRNSGEKTRVGNREIVMNNSSMSQAFKRGRGRPRLTPDEKQRRKELREMGLMKRSHRRTKEGNVIADYLYM